MRMPCPAVKPTSLSIRRLFSYCPEISAEFRRVFQGPVPLLDLENPVFLYDKKLREAWLRFSIDRADFTTYRLSAPTLIPLLQSTRSSYAEVKSDSPELRTFQSTMPKK